MIFESHAHYEDRKFDSDRVELLSMMKKKNIGTIINVGTTLELSRASIDLAHEYDFIYAAVGVHPGDIECLEETPDGLEQLRAMAESEKKVVAIGEIGLDFYWEKDEAVRERQRYWFLQQLDLARQVDLPVIIHSRDANEETYNIMKEAAAQGTHGVIHCYSGSPEMAEQYVKLGYYIGIGGVVTFKNGKKLKETAKRVPLENILVETDAPYMAPEPFRGERNDSTFLPYVIKQISELREMTVDEVMEVTRENGRRLFNITADDRRA
ncbi:MAG: TatD family hydrolase [Lachnospiraceae bacterium]|nr:TatD family hydrolase [Lachnospiraceae bacterium]